MQLQNPITCACFQVQTQAQRFRIQTVSYTRPNYSSVTIYKQQLLLIVQTCSETNRFRNSRSQHHIFFASSARTSINVDSACADENCSELKFTPERNQGHLAVHTGEKCVAAQLCVHVHLKSCTKRPQQQVNALALNGLDAMLTEEVLQQLDIEDHLASDFVSCPSMPSLVLRKGRPW